MNCAATKGFLTLGSCGNPAARTCSQCSQPTCATHLSPASGFSTCYACAATQPAREKKEGEEEVYDETWAHGYRSAYYGATGYTAVRAFDNTDRTSFHNRATDEFDDENETGGFDAS